MLLLFAPLLTIVALLFGGLASVVAVVLNGPRRLRRRPEPPLVVLPPVLTPAMRELVEQERDRPVPVGL